MDTTTCNNFITKYFNTFFSKGYRVYVPKNTYVYSNTEVFRSIANDVDEVIANAKKYDSSINNFSDIFENFQRSASGLLFDGIYIMPNFKSLIENKLRTIINANPDIQIAFEDANDNYDDAQPNQVKQLNVDISRLWYDMMKSNNMNGTFYKRQEFTEIAAKCENLNGIIEDKFFVNYIMVKPFFTLIDCVNRGYVNENVIEDYINVVASEEFMQKLDRYTNNFVEQYIGTTTFYKKVCDYINNLEKACLHNEKGMKPVERKITINFNMPGEDTRLRFWQDKGRSGQDNLETYGGCYAYALAEYRLADTVHGVRRKRTNENVSNYIKMNKKGAPKDSYVDATKIRFASKNDGDYGKSHFVFANRKKTTDGYKYINDFYNPCEYMVLQVPLMWSAIGLEPTSVVNFLPDMGADMEMKFNF